LPRSTRGRQAPPSTPRYSSRLAGVPQSTLPLVTLYASLEYAHTGGACGMQTLLFSGALASLPSTPQFPSVKGQDDFGRILEGVRKQQPGLSLWSPNRNICLQESFFTALWEPLP
uniref:Uncharacterized protein n=1 Tax=Chrysemys picta bellii TaxID=8478 RepID=A0A8C3IT59_CHRPI